MKGASEVKNHPWLKYYPWKELYEKSLESPFIPKLGDNFDKKFCESPDKIGETTKSRYEKYIQEDNFKIAFRNFTIININKNNKNIKEELKEKIKEKDREKDKDKDRDRERKKFYNTTIKPKHTKSSSLINPQTQNIYLNENNNNNNNFNISSIMNNTGIINNTNIKSINMNNININGSANGNGNHKRTKSVNKINSNLIQGQINEKDNRNIDIDKEKDKNKRNLEYTPERIIQNSSLYEHRSAAPAFDIVQGKLPNINNIDRIKIRKLINSNNSSLLFKYYKSNSINKNVKADNNNNNNFNSNSNSNINDGNGLLMRSQIFNKKNYKG
jgi:hypothetical protein